MILGSSDCNFSPRARQECGYLGMNQGACQSRGCCWDTSFTKGGPWCFHKKNACAHRDNREDCGILGTNSLECGSKGCCWDSRFPNIPWCFKPKNI